MSLSWRNRVQILLGPQRVALGKPGRGHGEPGNASHVEPCAPAGGWGAAVTALDAALRALDCRGAAATLILSNAFLRYRIVPWHDGIGRGAEYDAFVRLCFQRVFGEVAGAWDLRVSGERYGAAAIGSAVDSDLLAAVRETAGKYGVRIGSVQPYLMWAFNRWRALMDRRDFCLVLVENGHACLALSVAGQWRAVRGTAVSGSDLQTAVAELVERELCLAALDPAQVDVYVRAPGQGAPGLRRDTLPRAVALGEPGGDSGMRAGDALFSLAVI